MGELEHSELRWTCKLKGEFKGAQDSLEKLVLQSRLVESFRIGINTDDRNIYVSDFNFCETEDVIESLILRFDKKDIPGDIVALNNFFNDCAPKILQLPQGYARQLEKDLALLKNNILDIVETVEVGTNALFGKEFSKLERIAQKNGLHITMVNPTTFNYLSMSKIQTAKEDAVFKEYVADFHKTFTSKFIKDVVSKKLKGLEVSEFVSKNVRKQVTKEIRNLSERYSDCENLQEFFRSFEKFLFDADTDFEEVIAGRISGLGVNVLVNNSELESAPIIFEEDPCFENLIGKVQDSLSLQPDRKEHSFRKLVAGSLLKANGGYLVVDLEELLNAPTGALAYYALRNALTNNKVKISRMHSLIGESVDADEIDVDVKVILLGSSELYEALYDKDVVFNDLFRTHADMDWTIRNSAVNQKKYSAYFKWYGRENKLLPVAKSGCEALVEEACGLAENKDCLSLEINTLTDLLAEADLIARGKKAKSINRAFIENAVVSKNHRNSLRYEKELNFMKKYSLLDVCSEKIGQINGLTVCKCADLIFGVPERITASAGVGEDGIIYPDVEAGLAQEILQKSIHIIDSYFKRKYCRDFPFKCSVHVTFEQSYSTTDGDSASATTICVILSALSKVQFRQYIGVTGSVDSFGNIQPVGEINAKIEGFYDACRNLGGLSGRQGVIMPYHNVKDLMLRPDVVKSVEEKKFHVFPVQTIDECIELLTGRPAEDIHNLVKAELLRLGLAYQRFGKSQEH